MAAQLVVHVSTPFCVTKHERGVTEPACTADLAQASGAARWESIQRQRVAGFQKHIWKSGPASRSFQLLP